MDLRGDRKPVGLFTVLILLMAVLALPFRMQQARADDGMTDLSGQKYGLFVHYVPGLTVNSNGTAVTDPNSLANSFDATRFANDLADAKVQYVIFTAWHSKMVALWPSQAMLKWGLPAHRVQRDLIGDMITAVKAKGIHVYLYTHPRDGMEFTAADRQKTGWGVQPPPPGKGWDPGPDFDRPKWNSFINDVYQELMQRYGDRIDGLYMDEGSPAADSQTVVDYPRLRSTIKAVSPHAVLIQNDHGSLYGMDKGSKEYGGWAELSQPNENLWPGSAEPVAAIFTETWWAQRSHSTLRYSARSMFRYTVLQAATNTDGGGIAWGAGPYAGGGWEPGVMTTLRQVGAWIDQIKPSILGTRPSTSYPVEPGTRIIDQPWGVATKSPDDRTEYIHVLKPPRGRTLTLPLPRDGKVFGAASLVKDGTPVALSQDIRGVRLTIPGSWDANDTAIKLTVASRSGPVALYRCYNGGDHMDTTDRTCESPRYALDGPLGYLYPTQIPGTVPLYRCYNGGDHMDTTDPNCETPAYAKDGPIGYLYATQLPGTVPLYRCYNGGDHMDTTDPNCETPAYAKDGPIGYIIARTVPLFRCYNGSDHMETTDRTCESPRYALDGAVGYLYPTQIPGTVPLYRCYNGGDHMETTDRTCESPSYALDGPLGYLYPTQIPGTVPLYRCYNGGDHMDTTDPNCETPAYAKDGPIGYIMT
ncbi:alpha-L-fucosidase [Streptomyces sp. L2]|uniref:alpha-L-fucosidase n=1 Tax=Streptomyces sp. L2 TaxID=2162665 RepID=UPI001F5117FE|nr:alpha-L-fucosidase [Streptomyces sp. L2]